MANEKRLIEVAPLIDECKECMNIEWNKSVYTTWAEAEEDFMQRLLDAPTVDAAPVVRGWWKEYSHSALVNWKNAEPVWADRAVYRCSRCDFGTIIKHNYCPRCGEKKE